VRTAVKGDYPNEPNVRLVRGSGRAATEEGMFYLVSVLDLPSRRCVGFAMDAPPRRGAGPGQVVHCDRGPGRRGHRADLQHRPRREYTGALFALACASTAITQSIGVPGTHNCGVRAFHSVPRQGVGRISLV
jgi:hypothetical protein